MQRVKAIDEKYSAIPRIYLDISFTKYLLPKKIITASDNVTVYYLNFFTGFYYILLQLQKATKVYCHSVYCFVKIVPFIFFFKKHLVVDMHGVVPEETAYQNKSKYLVWFYSFYESVIFKSASAIVCVTNSMVNYFKQKYPLYNGEYFVYTIMPQNLREYQFKIPLSTDNIQIIYSGNIQKWQNVDMMLATIARGKKDDIKYTILTLAKDAFINMLDEREIDLKAYNIEITSVVPSGLHEYYVKAHYGFIFRDDSIVNRVANPTKLVEYLHYGITPIVLNPFIGDYREYDYVLIEDFDINSLRPEKSVKNMNVIKLAKQKNDQINIIEI